MASIRPEADVVYITSAEVLSVRERMHSPKRYVYEVSVDWSDSNTTTCYRGYTDFFDFQCELLSTFPFEAGAVKGIPRTIPYLPGRKLFQRSTADKRLRPAAGGDVGEGLAESVRAKVFPRQLAGGPTARRQFLRSQAEFPLGAPVSRRR